ncbi:MAG: MBL fold metallo-hydrolase [Candidatus Acidiferrales bacterium]
MIEERDVPICVTCGTQFPGRQEHCPICEDSRQFVGWEGQQWTTLKAMSGKYRNQIKQEEAGLFSIQTEEKFAIGQRAYLIQTADGNLLWDCVSLLDDATIASIRSLGGIAAIAISHPHYHATMVAWSCAFGNAPIHLHAASSKWVMRPHGNIQFWDGETKQMAGGLTLIHTPGHFEGFQVLHSERYADGLGALFCGDQPRVCMDRRWVTFMYSYPNFIPLAAAAVRDIVRRLEGYSFDRIYAAVPGWAIASGAHEAVRRSADRYLRALGI